MRIAVTGSTGFVAAGLLPVLTAAGHEVVRVVRTDFPAAGDVPWDPSRGTIDLEGLEGVDAVVNLAGENIAGRWTNEKKIRIRESRVGGTRLLAGALARLAKRPRVLVCASAVGIYGDRGDEVLTEESGPGRGFLAEVCRLWEDAATPAREAGIRTVHTRFGIVLDPSGGALEPMLVPFRLGLGGRLGSGDQWFPWVSRDDLARALLEVLTNEAYAGPVNVCSPNPVTNRELTKALGRALHRPTVFAVPAFAARALFGELADEGLLASERAVPGRLSKAGFAFRDPTLPETLERLLAA